MSQINHDKLLELAYKIRLFESKLLELSSKKKLMGTVHTCIGQELIPVSLLKNLNEDDVVISNHRGHGHFLAKTNAFKKLAHELIGDLNGLNKGIGGSQHLKAKNFYASGVQGSLLPFSLGLSYELKNTQSIVVAFVGDGTFGQGVLYEVLNWASLWALPVLFVVEDNGYAQSTKKENNFAGSFKSRANAFDIEFFEASNFVLDDLYNRSQDSINYVRSKRKPAMLHVETYRLSPHSKGDDLRDKTELDLFKNKDIVSKYELSLSNELCTKLKEEIDNYFEIEKVQYREIHQDEIFNIIEEEKKEKLILNNESFFSKEINLALQKCFEENKDLMMIGEDLVDPYGGAFKISQNLSRQFPGRILNTPISEATIIGFAAGRSSIGKRTIAEIMFGDFFGLAFDQFLNVISKFQSMYGKKADLPITIRMPVGPGGGYGPTHSQEVSQYLSNIPFIEHRIPTMYSDIKKFYMNSILAENNNAIVIYEPKKLYTTIFKTIDPDLEKKYKFNQVGKSGTANICIESNFPEMTILLHPFYSTECENLLRELSLKQVEVDVFIPECMNYFAENEIKKSLIKTKKLFIWDSGNTLNGHFTELIKKIQKNIVFDFDYQVVPMNSIPASELENELFYNIYGVINKLRELYEK